jgi:hypothetical protein
VEDFAKIASYLGQPLVLVGFVIFLFFGILKQLVDPTALRNSPHLTARIGVLFLTYGFVIAIVTIVLGFGLSAMSYMVTQK